ncbi:hypothetical protein FGO68_gene5358 [Halteria grandinella]|uniref:Uncharacterized protein n=1 Tax=Halteria grandinella TaxID=5974 RepID=A0A8J8SUW4_HALGN|nr:hypothetical protein FGO68_gene5358 [Halteria grandinella]
MLQMLNMQHNLEHSLCMPNNIQHQYWHLKQGVLWMQQVSKKIQHYKQYKYFYIRIFNTLMCKFYSQLNKLNRHSNSKSYSMSMFINQIINLEQSNIHHYMYHIYQ